MPELGEAETMVTVIVGRLNDYKHWTREAIADWLEGHGL